MRKGNAYCVTLVHMLTVVTSNVPQIALCYMNTFPQYLKREFTAAILRLPKNA